MKKSILLTIFLTLFMMAFGLYGFAQWTQANTGLSTTGVNSFATIGTTLFVSTGNISGNGQGVYKSTDNGANWSAANTGLLSMDTRKIIAVADTLFVAVAGTNITDGGIYKSTDNGGTWTQVSNGLARKVAYSIVHHAGTLYTSISAPGGIRDVYLSTDYGNNWTKTTSTVLNDRSIKSIVSIGGNIIACAEDNEGGIVISSDNGASWLETYTSGADELEVIGSTVFAATGTGVKKSLDNGNTWLPTTSVSGVIDNATALASIDSCLIVATPSGRVFSSNNAGTSWTDVSTGASMSLGAEALHTHASYMFAGIDITSPMVWRRPLSEFNCGPAGLKSIVESSTIIWVYPNPNNGKFTIKNDGNRNCELTISNMLGEKIYRDAHFSGRATKQVDISNAPAGVYFIKIADGINSYTNKIIIR